MRPLLTALLLSALMTGCGRYFAPDRNVKEVLAESDVIGTWRMTTNSLALLTRDGLHSNPAHSYTITFQKDGSCSFRSVEEFAHKGTYVSASGVWKLGHEVKRGENAKVKNLLQMELNVEGSTHFHHLCFAREHGVLVLWEFYGDPDEWEFIEYARGG